MNNVKGIMAAINIEGQEEIKVSDKNQTLYDVLSDADIFLEAVCGGKGTCGKCKVTVLKGQVVDRDGMPAQPEKDGRFLACKVFPVGDVVLDKIEKRGISAKGEISKILISPKHRFPALRKSVVKTTYPTLEEHYSLQDMIHAVSGEGLNLDMQAIRELALIAPEKPEAYTLIHTVDTITAIEAGDTSPVFYGVAFDIGSTTVAGMLVDVNSGEVIAAASETNPQAAFGADVISRIKVAGTEAGLNNLSSIIRSCLNCIIGQLCSKGGIERRDIYLITVVGNSTMGDLLTGVSPTNFTISPYAQVFKFLPPLLPNDVALDIHPGGRVLLMPNIASFVGSDTTGAVMAMDQDLTSKLTLLIDLGTNGEIVLGNRDKLIVSSTAAGPAFEGGQLSGGMRATAGAIDDVVIGEDVSFRTINNQKPAGICGSGIIKALAEMLRVGIITASGRLAKGHQVDKLPLALQARLKKTEGMHEFVLAFAGESATGSDVVITQADIREIQLVKSSLCTGSEILMEELRVHPEDVEQVFIAGAFGSFIDLDSALAIGLIPVRERWKVRSVGNAAGEGAAKALLSKYNIDRCKAIAEKAGFIELANHPQFQKRFMKNLEFPGCSSNEQLN